MVQLTRPDRFIVIRYALWVACVYVANRSLAQTGPCDFVVGEETFELPTNPMPEYLAPTTDPLFGTRVTRVTDPDESIPTVGGTWGSVARHHYSLDQAWNADMSLLQLDRGTSGLGKLYLDGQTYEPLFFRDSPGDDRWHPTQPDVRIFVDENRIGTWNVRTGAISVIATMEGYTGFEFGPNKGNPSRNGNRLVVVANNPAGTLVAFAYDLQSRQKFPEIDVSDVNLSWAGISPLGNYIVVHKKSVDQANVYDVQGKFLNDWPEYGRPSHYDLTVDENGDEVAVGVSKSDPDKGLVIKRRLRDGAVTALTRGGYASHTSARAILAAEWVFVSYNDNPSYPPYRAEVIAVRIDGSEVRRLFSTHRLKTEYTDETHPCPSPDGTKVIWASNWDVGGGPVASYVTELCVGGSGPLPRDTTKPNRPLNLRVTYGR